MGLFSGIKKVFKKVTSAVKSVAKSIKKVGSQVWGGIKSGLGKVAGVFGKLGPLGTIAMSFVMPGIGSMLAGMWSTTAASLAGSSMGWVQAVGQGMQTAANIASQAKTFVGNAYSSITDKIKDGLTHIAGSVDKGANAIFKGAQEYMKVEKPMSIQDVGKWVTDKAKSVYEGATGSATPATPADTSLVNQKSLQSAVNANPELVKMANYGGTTPQQIAADQGQFLGDRFSSQAVTQQALKENPELVKMANYGGEDPSALVTPGMEQSARTNLGVDAFAGSKSDTRIIDSGSSLLSRIAKGAAGALGGFAAGTPDTGVTPYAPAAIPGIGTPIRGGVGGYGSEGGFFLSEAQRRQQAMMAQQLGQIG